MKKNLSKKAEESPVLFSSKSMPFPPKSSYFKILIENSADLVALCDSTGNFIYSSPSTKNLFGYEQDEFINIKFSDLIHPEDLVSVAGPSFEKVLKNPGNVVTYVFRAKHKSGVWRWIESTKTNFLHDPLVQAIIINFRDVTEGKNISDELVRSQERLNLAQEAGRIGVYEWNMISNEIVWAGGIERLYGRKIGELGNSFEHWAACVYPDDLPKALAENERAIKTGMPFEYELRIVWPDLSTHWLLIKSKAYYKDGKPIKMVGVNVDIDARKAAEAQLQYQADLLKNVSDAIVSTDKDYNIFSWNKGAEQIYGWTEEDVLGKPAREFLNTKYLHGESLQSVTETVNKRGIWRGEVIQKTKNGEDIYILSSISKVQKDSLDLGVVAVNRDITDRKKYEETLKNHVEEIKHLNADLEQRVEDRTKELTLLNKRLITSNQELQDFAYISSHDLREPLRKITSFVNLLSSSYKNELSPQARQYLEAIDRSTKRMNTLITDLLTYSRVTTKAKPFDRISLAAVMYEVMYDLEIIIESKKASIEIGQLPEIYADPIQMQLLMQNLISNALKYCRPGTAPEIKILCEESKNHFKIIVSDNGIGIDNKYLDKIFIMFQRLHGRNEYEGTGIGLAICKKIVERHNGKINVKSELGKGSTFIVSLPK